MTFIFKSKNPDYLIGRDGFVKADDLLQLTALARDCGASFAKAIPASDVVVDPRVRLKCQVPLCPNYGVNLMCPPNVPAVAEFADALLRYRRAILVQVPIELIVEGASGGERDLQDIHGAGDYEPALVASSRRLANVVREVEAKALALGHHFAAGFTAGSCRLCDECVTIASGKACRLPFRARPAMEAMGIDVVATAARAGPSITFGNAAQACWTGLVLIG